VCKSEHLQGAAVSSFDREDTLQISEKQWFAPF